MYGEDAEVEVGYQIEFPKRTDVLGRIAAQTAKQVIFQKVREAEREIIFAEYNQRVGEVMNGIVKRFEQGDIIVEVGRVEAILPRKEQSRAESYTQGDRLRAVIKNVGKSAKGPQIVLSRTDPALLIKLFEQEVPEIYDGTVMIRGAVREAGDRAKVAVYSRERDVDPVGACVGMKGTRVQAIIRELRGEKIDIVEWSDDPVCVRHQRAVAGEGAAGDDRQRPGKGDGGRGRGQAAVTGHRQEGTERPARREADRLADRHQERGREAEGSRGAARRARGLDERGFEAPAEAGSRGIAEYAPGEAPVAGRRTRWSISCRHEPPSRPPLKKQSPGKRQERVTAEEEGTLATVRIYKVAELLNTTSQEVLQLLKQNPRHRAEERVEHARRNRGATVRRAARATARDRTAQGRHLFGSGRDGRRRSRAHRCKKGAAPAPPASPPRRRCRRRA